MYAGMMGNLQWSMCVSCGAWLAVQLWDHSLFDLQPEVLQTRVLPILRGAVEFFSGMTRLFSIRLF